MSTTTVAQKAAFDAAKNASEGRRQQDIGVAKATLTGADITAAIKSADRAHAARVYAAGLLNNVDANAFRQSFNWNPPPPEAFTRTDSTTATLVGGRYIVSVVATFGGAGLVTFVNAGGDVLASFTANGQATIDVPFGVYNFTLSDTTGMTAGIRVCGIDSY